MARRILFVLTIFVLFAVAGCAESTVEAPTPAVVSTTEQAQAAQKVRRSS